MIVAVECTGGGTHALVDDNGKITPWFWFDLAKAYAREGLRASARAALALGLSRLRENTGRAVAWAPASKAGDL